MRYVKPPAALLKGISVQPNQDIALDVYCSDQTLLREFFWFRLRLLTWLMRSVRPFPGECLDFGGGSGVFAASLATGFERVTLIDMNTDEATILVSRLGLSNVRLVKANITAFDFGADAFDAITAADVLEHFADLAPALAALRRWLKPSGVLFTSLPTENLWYRMLRVAFAKQKPHDHYHSAAEVERELSRAGFRKVAGLYHPLVIPAIPLFRISAWKKSE